MWGGMRDRSVGSGSQEVGIKYLTLIRITKGENELLVFEGLLLLNLESMKKFDKYIFSLKGIDRPFGEGVENILIRSVLVNWRLGYFFYLILKGLLLKISKKP